MERKSIIVTGASSGIGRAIAIHLAKLGYCVLATVRKQEDAARLNQLGFENLIPLFPLDFTSQIQIATSSQYIIEKIGSKEFPPLYSVIFVAGGGHIAPVELMDVNNFRDELEKRLVGTVSLLQKLIPFLRETKGRILWIATPGLFPVPFVADIHAPDFAVNYLARTLNLELKPDGIKNILIRCGGIDTESPKRAEHNLIGQIKGFPENILNIYRNRLTKTEAGLKKFAVKRTTPDKVAQVVSKVLSVNKPKTRYQVGYLSWAGAFLEKLPQSWVDFIMMKREG